MVIYSGLQFVIKSFDSPSLDQLLRRYALQDFQDLWLVATQISYWYRREQLWIGGELLLSD